MHVEFEERIGAALRGTADAFTPGDPPALVAAGHARGRRLRRRRTAGVVAGVVAVVLVAAGGLAAGTVLARPGGPADVLPPAARARPVVTGEEMSAALSSLLRPAPYTYVTGLPPGSGTHPTPPRADAIFQGDVMSDAIVLFLGNSDSRRATCPPPAPYLSCTVAPAQGGTLTVSATSAFTKGRNREDSRITVWFRTDRYTVVVNELGSMRDTPDDLPVSQADIVRIALAGVWGRLAATLPPSIPAPAPSSGVIPVP